MVEEDGFMPSYEELTDNGTLCNYCDASGSHCEGVWCERAYARYTGEEHDMTPEEYEQARQVNMVTEEAAMDNKDATMTFSFDWNEVFKNIERGVVERLTDKAVEEISDSVKSRLLQEGRNILRFDTWDKKKLWDEIKEEVHNALSKEIKQFTEELINKRVERTLDNIGFGERYIQAKADSYIKEKVSETIRDSLDSLKYHLRDVYKQKMADNAELFIQKLTGASNAPSSNVSNSVPQSELDRLMERDRMLCALESAGVDNWEGYEYAMDILREQDEEADS